MDFFPFGQIHCCTLPKINSSPLKIKGGKMKFPFGAGAIFKGELLVSGRITIGYHWWKATCGLQRKHTETSQAMRCIFKSFRKKLEKFHSIFPSKISMPISSSRCFFSSKCVIDKQTWVFARVAKKKHTHFECPDELDDLDLEVSEKCLDTS